MTVADTHTFDVSDLDDARDTTPVPKLEVRELGSYDWMDDDGNAWTSPIRDHKRRGECSGIPACCIAYYEAGVPLLDWGYVACPECIRTYNRVEVRHCDTWNCTCGQWVERAALSLDFTSAASLTGNSAGAAVRHGAAEVTFTVAEHAREMLVTVTRGGKSVTVTMPIGDDDPAELIAARVVEAINRTKDEILW